MHCICKRLLGLRLQNRCSVAKPDPATPHGQSSRGAAEGEGRFPTATTLCKSSYEKTSSSVCHTYLPQNFNFLFTFSS